MTTRCIECGYRTDDLQGGRCRHCAEGPFGYVCGECGREFGSGKKAERHEEDAHGILAYIGGQP